jgi:hypothetical protein
MPDQPTFPPEGCASPRRTIVTLRCETLADPETISEGQA